MPPQRARARTANTIILEVLETPLTPPPKEEIPTRTRIKTLIVIASADVVSHWGTRLSPRVPHAHKCAQARAHTYTHKGPHRDGNLAPAGENIQPYKKA